MRTLLQSLLTLLLLASCVAPRSSFHRLEPGVVKQITIDMGRSNGVSPLWGALWLAAIGSGIGSGTTAHVIGAGGGALAGGALGYAHDQRLTKRVNRTVEVAADSGVLYRLPVPGTAPLRIGQHVWVAFDSRGRPQHVVAMPVE